MNQKEVRITDTALETLARGLYKETQSYGFQQLDYVRFVNRLLDCAMKRCGEETEAVEERVRFPDAKTCSALPLRSERVNIREIQNSDIPVVEKWLQDPEGRHFLLSRTTAINALVGELLDKKKHRTGIIMLPDGEIIGAMAYLDLDVVQKKAELRKLIGEKKWRGKGLAKESTILWIQYGIVGLKLKKIIVSTLDTNIRNVKLNESLGFRIEGILRDEILVDGVYRDVLRMGLCSEEIANL